ncbi:MAG: NADH-quinone oxidoreductase subunit A [Acidobacteria bacterium RIFCSPLOWO2_02_FULL_61_28]|nr:MAG: NADH-quinone oxidoreductase subunit A [Acidobacteria bacterium RIFCSPLOWO2_02_FULL_61_28]
MPNTYFQNYLVILLMLGVVVLLAGGMIVLSYLLGQHRPSRVKLSPYECGMVPTGDARQRFSVKFYLVAMVFILFDVEIVFLYPWAVIFHELRMFGFLEMLLFLLLVGAGFAYLWKMGVLDWTGSDTGGPAGGTGGSPAGGRAGGPE